MLLRYLNGGLVGVPWVVARKRMNTRNSRVVARVGECCRCECVGCGQYGWVQMDCPPQYLADKFGVVARHLEILTRRCRTLLAGCGHVEGMERVP
ncbi:hypothetical protein DEO72_LG10g1752 [Vigna unguiculata]|uniref:Uncharacterized protein n=1 Tax=Vigna unguiculata TaxID=3917 RepID=A0A4D6NC91_VIGUN|nr:hypothetical protein DEO72_LG10g1752 [Vigna unguiculata]